MSSERSGVKKMAAVVFVIALVVAVVSAKFAFFDVGSRITILETDVYTANEGNKKNALYVMLGSSGVCLLILLGVIIPKMMKQRTSTDADGNAMKASFAPLKVADPSMS